MMRTIVLGSCVSIQGQFEKSHPDGRISVRVGEKVFVGTPVVKTA